MSPDCPDVNPVRTKHYINFGEDDQMEIIGYHRNILKTVTAWIFIILTLGLLRLIFFWRPEWMLKCMSDLCSLDSAQYVLLKAYFIDEIVGRRLQPALSKLLFKESVKHRIVEKDLSLEFNWPLLTFTDISKVVEMENSAFANLTRKLEADKMKSQDDVSTKQHINLAFEADDDYTRPSCSGSVDEGKKIPKVYTALVKNSEGEDCENNYLDQDDTGENSRFESVDLADEQTDLVPLVIDKDEDEVDGIQLFVL